MSDLQTYETTQLDWAAIESLAVRAAKETPLKPAPPLGYVKKNGEEFVDICGPHWLLDKRYEWNEEVSEYVTEESYHECLYALMPDGQLVEIFISKETSIHRINPSNFSSYNTHSVHPMTEDDVTSFDFSRGYHESGYGTDRHIWGNSDRVYNRKELLQTRKGAGLSLLLENIRTGRAKQDEKLSSAQETGETRAQLLPDLTRFHHTTEERAKVVAAAKEERAKVVAAAKAEASAAAETVRRRRHREIDQSALVICAVAALSIVVPWAIGHYILRGWILEENPAVFAPEIRALLPYIWAEVVGGWAAIALITGAVLVLRPWRARAFFGAIGVVLLVVGFWAFGTGKSLFASAENESIDSLARTAFPFSESFHECGTSFQLGTSTYGVFPPTALWQVFLGRDEGYEGEGCNRIVVYRGWAYMGHLSLTDGEEFDDAFGGRWVYSYTDGEAFSDFMRLINHDLAGVWINARTTWGRVVSTNLVDAGNGGLAFR